MRAYEWFAGGQRHLVIAESMARAVELVRLEYNDEPEALSLLSVYVIIEPTYRVEDDSGSGKEDPGESPTGVSRSKQ